MCKTTKGTQAAASDSVRGIQPNEGTGPGPDPEVVTNPPLFGQPDYAPQLTYIAQPSSAADSFISLAMTFHQNSGLDPTMVTSIEEMIDKLADSTLTGTGPINRLRIVSHVFFDTSGLGQPVNMMLRFLEDGTRLSLKRHFSGFAASGLEGLKAMMTFEVGTFDNTTHFLYSDPATSLMSLLRPAHNAILDLIPTDPLGDPTGEFNDFFLLCGSKWALSQMTEFNSSQKITIDQAYDLLLDDLIPRIAGAVTVPQLNKLKNAISDLGSGAVVRFQLAHNPSEYAQNVGAAIAAISGDAFTTKLNTVRQRFNQNSKVDIRGCQVGRDPDYLRALQSFFGTSTTVRPGVSGPLWFQHFNEIGNITGLNTNAGLVGLHNSGFSPYSATDVRQFLDDWCTAFGITDAHLTFWQETLGLDVLSFCALAWRSSLPGTRIPVVRLQALPGADFADLIGRISSIFLLSSSATPNATDIASINPTLSDLASWATQLNAAVADSATPAQLTAHFNNYKTIYEGVDKRFTGTSSPSAGQRVIPTAVPNPLNAGVIRGLQTDLNTFIDSHAQSRFRPFKRFIDGALARANDAPAKMRYFLSLGLPFLAYNPAATNVNHNLLVVYFDGASVTIKRQDEAIKYWIRSQWRGLMPAAIGAGTTFANSRHTPWLVENRQPGQNLTVSPFRVSPTEEFNDEIVSISP